MIRTFLDSCSPQNDMEENSIFSLKTESDGLFSVDFSKPEHAAHMEGKGWHTSTKMVVFTRLLKEELDDISVFFQRYRCFG
jgi:hypothetical protein